MKTITKIILSCLYIALYFIVIFVFELTDNWFSISLIFIGLYQLYLAIKYKRDSSTWFGSLLLYYGVFGIVMPVYYSVYNLTTALYIFGISFASAITYLFFRQNIHAKVVAIFTIQMLLLVVFECNYLMLTEFILLQILYTAYVVSNLIQRIKINTRSKNNGEL